MKLGINSTQETSLMFIENAILKACQAGQKNRYRKAIANDSVLEVDAIGGTPSIYSAYHVWDRL